MTYSRPTASNMKSPQKSQIVTSDYYDIIISYYQSKCLKSRPSVLTQARSRPRHIIECLAMTRWCRPDKIMQQSGAAAVHILIENLYKFINFGVKKLILEFSDKS